MVGLVKQSGPHGGSSEAVRATWRVRAEPGEVYVYMLS